MNLCRSKPAVCVKLGKSGKYPYMRQCTAQSFFVLFLANWPWTNDNFKYINKISFYLSNVFHCHNGKMQGVKIILFKIFMLDIFAQFFLKKMEHVNRKKKQGGIIWNHKNIFKIFHSNVSRFQKLESILRNNSTHNIQLLFYNFVSINLDPIPDVQY